MEEKNNILGCFVTIGFNPNLTEQDFVKLDETFTPYIWGEKGICNSLKKLNHTEYGKDLTLALFQFYVMPTAVELQNLKEIEGYRKNEKSIGIPVIVNDNNFFSKSEVERRTFLKQSILQKLNVLAEVVKKKKLDTNMELLKSDVQKVLS